MSEDVSNEENLAAIVRRIFVAAAQRSGGASALARQLRIHYSELQMYMRGEAMPPEEILLGTVELAMDGPGGAKLLAEHVKLHWRAGSTRRS